MKFWTALAIMIAVPTVTVLGIWSYDMIEQSIYEYRYEKKMDQVYENFLVYGPEFLGKYWNQTESYFGSWEDWRTWFDRGAKDYYRDIDKKIIYYKDYPHNILITGADYNTFVILENFYSRDKNYLYLAWQRTSFDLSLHPKNIWQFIVDNKHVFTEEETLLTWADAATFHNIEYEQGRWSLYYKDKYAVYVPGEILTWADAKTFQVLNVHYGKDKNYIYYSSLKVNGADVETFQVFDEFSSYAKDKNNIYIWMKILTWADVESFELIDTDTSKAKDKNHRYEYGKIVEEK